MMMISLETSALRKKKIRNIGGSDRGHPLQKPVRPLLSQLCWLAKDDRENLLNTSGEII
ncbi:hypothetical protein RvY_03573 [Ramazzottius varieornatus]|uniref:Uncharacterized protein n=1 Tax=Ramazzottius varieornatus TaxID=947166 RepID=A0A1D1URX9_RAMVA|nr:hypothetical protein RvY_03573 [Ramazzottius varieornatus]